MRPHISLIATATAPWPTLPAGQLCFQRGAAGGIVELGIIVAQRFCGLDPQGGEHRTCLLDDMAGLLLEAFQIGKVMHLRKPCGALEAFFISLW